MGAKCKDVNRDCEFGEPFENTSDIIEETISVVVNRIMSDDITTQRPTGKYYRNVESKKVCKFCGNTQTLNSHRKYV